MLLIPVEKFCKKKFFQQYSFLIDGSLGGTMNGPRMCANEGSIVTSDLEYCWQGIAHNDAFAFRKKQQCKMRLQHLFPQLDGQSAGRAARGLFFFGGLLFTRKINFRSVKKQTFFGSAYRNLTDFSKPLAMVTREWNPQMPFERGHHFYDTP